MYQHILYAVEDPIATITLNRPEALNAWTTQMGLEVRHAVAQAENDPAVFGIIITGAGRGFSAGADMKMLSRLSDGSNELADSGGPDLTADPGDPAFGEDFRGEYTYLMAVPKPIVAAINGPVAGMSVAIALACDLRFMAADAVLTTAFSQRGLVAEWGISWLLPRLVGPSAAMDLLFSSRKIKGDEAAQLGLVNAVVPAGEAYEHSRAYLMRMAESASPASIAIMKRQINQQTHAGLGPAEREAQRLMVESFRREDFKEGVDSFMQKRPPKFRRLGE
jgi:enoyl-CoA hydratase/carnithine racemase